MLRAVPRTAVRTTLSLARLPLDTALSVFAGGGKGAETRPQLALDRVDAAVRSFAGKALFDRELQRDGALRKAAADERGRALRLRAAAEQTSAAATESYEERREQAEQQRAAAEQRAAEQRRKAEQDKQAELQRLSKTERKRRETVKATTDRTEKAIDDQARRARLAQLDDAAEALDDKQAALTEREQASRLAEAAAELKAVRKSS